VDGAADATIVEVVPNFSTSRDEVESGTLTKTDASIRTGH